MLTGTGRTVVIGYHRFVFAVFGIPGNILPGFIGFNACCYVLGDIGHPLPGYFCLRIINIAAYGTVSKINGTLGVYFVQCMAVVFQTNANRFFVRKSICKAIIILVVNKHPLQIVFFGTRQVFPVGFKGGNIKGNVSCSSIQGLVAFSFDNKFQSDASGQLVGGCRVFG